MIAIQQVQRYATPLREGGSLPGIVEADDLGTYVAKFRGAGQGPRVLAAEVIVSGIATRLGIRTPRLVGLELSAEIARYEADEEVQDLLRASVGLNLGVDFLPGAFGFDRSSTAGEEGAAILWCDAFTANVDRSWRNPNLLVWHREVWAIDHGAALYFHHGWGPERLGDPARFAAAGFAIDDHVFADRIGSLSDLDDRFRALLSADGVLEEIVAEVPDEWLPPAGSASTPAQVRSAYVAHLHARLGSSAWLPNGAA